jgi:hypothetical protein
VLPQLGNLSFEVACFLSFHVEGLHGIVSLTNERE